MKVLVACEFSGIVRDAFRARGHNAWSCDLLPCEGDPKRHIQGDITGMGILDDRWDLLIAHPPCTHLCCSGARHFEEKRKDGRQQAAIDFFLMFTKTPIRRWCIENPVGIMSTVYRKPDQIIQPYHFGEPVKKTTHLWMRGLTPLADGENMPLFESADTVVEPELVTISTGKTFSKWEYDISMDHKNRSHRRSVTFQCFADAMADQWGCL